MAETLAEYWYYREEYRSKQENVTDYSIIMDVKTLTPEKKFEVGKQFC